MKKSIKYIIYALIAVIIIIAAFIAYRLFFMFNSKKVNEYIEKAAATTTDANTAFKVITEMVQSIKKSQDETAAVLAMAAAEHMDREQKLVETALYKCYSLGFLINPMTEVQTEEITA